MTEAAENSTLSVKRRLSLSFRMLKQAWTLRPAAMLLYFAGAFLEIASSIVAIYATARLGGLLAGFATGGSTAGIWQWLWVDIISGMFIGFGFLLMSYSKRMLYFAFVRWSTTSFQRALCSIDLPAFYDDSIRNQINKVSGAYTWQLPNLNGSNLDLIYGILRFIAITLVVSQITWWIVPLIGVFLIPTLLGESRMAKLQWFVWDEKGDQRHIFWGLDWIIRNAKGQMELRSSRATNYVLNKIYRMNTDFYSEQEKRYKHANKLLIPTKISESIGTAIGAVVVLRQFLSGTIALERYFFLSGALIRVGGALNSIFGTLSQMQESLLFADSYFSLMEDSPKISDAKNASQLSTRKAPDIVFENVSFTYPKQSNPIFKDLNLTISSGEHVALVGENGAGKSTLIKLLLRFYKPDSGRILINNIDLQSLQIESWYEQIATLFQTFNEYPLPIKENIQIGRSTKKPDATLLQKAAKFGGVDTMVNNYTHGWDTVLDSSFKKGVEPSGGQWQRVALSRAFYRQANVLILDEPTSAIDAKAEYTIFNNIFEHYKNKTAIIVSHRFSTVRRADRIIVLDEGSIIEQGTHTELIQKKGLYESMFTKQAEGYRD